jgi:hypothetical protein
MNKELLFKLFLVATFAIVAFTILMVFVYVRKMKKFPATLQKVLIILGIADFCLLCSAILDPGLIILILGISTIITVVGVIKNLINKATMTPLIKAAAKGDMFKCKQLIETGKSVDEKTALGDTALILASANGHLETVKYLISKGANINAHGKNEHTPLIAALENKKKCNHELLKILLEQRIQIDARDKKEYTALYHAVFNENIEAVKLLIQFGANVNATITYLRNKKQITKGILSIVPSGSNEIKQLLIDAGATETWDESIGRF